MTKKEALQGVELFVLDMDGTVYLGNRLIDGALTVLDSIRSLPSAQIETFTPSVLTGVLMLLLMFSVSGYVLRPLKARMKIGMAVFFLFTTSIIADIIRL